MGMKIFYCVSAFILLSLLSCNQKKAITNKKDYAAFLNRKVVGNKEATLTKEIDFWNKRLLADTSSYVSKLELAKLYAQVYAVNGNIVSLNKSDSLLHASSAKINHSVPEILYSLAQSSIGQHQFKRAGHFVEKATALQADKFTLALLSFDVNMELGNFSKAGETLKQIQNSSSFDYLIRKAKWDDHNGNLPAAIKNMETAFEKVKDKNTSLFTWTLSNLGDMYGHAGKLKEAYQCYLQVLAKDSANLYCLKGIARIAWLQDNNTAAAKQIIHYILSQNNMPDLYLLLSEIAYAENNKAEGDKAILTFLSTVSSPTYGNMYNKYLISLYAEQKNTIGQAVQLAKKEVQERPTPETYSWLGYAYLKNGNQQAALACVQRYVYNQTFEPEAQLYAAFVFNANGKKEIAKKLLLECKASSFELGPVAMQEVDKELAGL
jgi:tetratricopeptide (TPR) repeat protein